MPTPDQFIADAVAALGRNPETPAHWHHLIECFIRFNRPAELLDLLQYRQTATADGISLLHESLVALMYKGLVPQVNAFLLTIPNDHLFLPQALFLRSWVAALKDDLDDMVGLTRRAVDLVSVIKSVAARDHRFVTVIYPKMVNQRDQIADRQTILALPDDEPPVPVQFDTPEDSEPAERVILTAANGRYINTFAKDWIAALNRRGTDGFLIHMHVIDADDDAKAILARLKAENRSIRTSWQTEGVVGNPAVYFACSRYLLASQILDHYQLPVVTLDIDLAFHQPVAAAVDRAAEMDVAWFETGEPPPSHRPGASLVYLNNTPGCRRFLVLLRALLGRRLRAGCNWMLDQTGLYCVSRALATEPGAFRRGELCALTGETLHDFVEQCPMKFEEKRVLRGWAAP